MEPSTNGGGNASGWVRPARVRQSSFGDDEELASGELPPAWTLQRFQAEATSALNEYFVARVLDDAVSRARELLTACPGEADELGVVAVRAALDRDQASQQAVVELFCKLHLESVMNEAAFIRSFEKLFCTWEDIAIDAPKAPEVLIEILMGCISGGVLRRQFLSKLPENLISAVLSKGQGPWHEALSGIAAEVKEFKHEATSCLETYFDDWKAEAVEVRLKGIGQAMYLHEFVKKALVMSFSQPDPVEAREVALKLLQHLTGAGALSKDDLQWGVTRLLGQLDDLELDCPRAADLTIEFFTCMVGDELVSSPFLRRCRQLRIGGATGIRVLDVAQRRTPEFSKQHMGTQQFKREIHTMILEYFNSGDKEEFGRCFRELAPLNAEKGAELIRKVMAFAMERTGATCEQALNLLVWLCRHEEISSDLLELGFNDLYSHMPDICLDVPDADEMARAFVVEAKKAEVLRHDWSSPASPES